jgi:hypothetical protein
LALASLWGAVSRSFHGRAAQLTTVEVERFGGNLPPIRAFDPMWRGGAWEKCEEMDFA